MALQKSDWFFFFLFIGSNISWLPFTCSTFAFTTMSNYLSKSKMLLTSAVQSSQNHPSYFCISLHNIFLSLCTKIKAICEKKYSILFSALTLFYFNFITFLIFRICWIMVYCFSLANVKFPVVYSYETSPLKSQLLWAGGKVQHPLEFLITLLHISVCDQL